MSIVLCPDASPLTTAALSEEWRERLDAVIDGENADPAALIPILHAAQLAFGHLPAAVQDYIANRLGIPVSDVHGVVTFYSLFVTEPQGEHSIHVCMGTACYVRGAARLLEALENRLGVKLGRTTRDGKVTLGQCRCLGVCDRAPAMLIDGKVAGPVSADEALSMVGKQEPVEG